MTQSIRGTITELAEEGETTAGKKIGQLELERGDSFHSAQIFAAPLDHSVVIPPSLSTTMTDFEGDIV